MDRYGLTRSTGAKGLFSGQRRRGGVLRSNEDGVRLSRALGGAYPRRGARPDRRLHPVVQPRAHQAVAWLDESGTIPSKPRNGCVIIFKKTSAPYGQDMTIVERVLEVAEHHGVPMAQVALAWHWSKGVTVPIS